MAYREQLDSLKKLYWPALTHKCVSWALHTPLCSLHSWSPVGPSPNQASVLATIDTEQVQAPPEIDMDERHDTSKEEVENIREDGELPLVPAATLGNDVKLTPSKGSDLEHSRRLALISKSVSSPISKGRSPSFKKLDDYLDLMLDSDGELVEPSQVEPETESGPAIGGLEMVDNSWVDCGVQEYCLVLTRKVDNGERNMKLEAKV